MFLSSGGLLTKMATHGALLGALTLSADYIARELDSVKGLTGKEKRDKRSEGFFQWPQRDPFKTYTP